MIETKKEYTKTLMLTKYGITEARRKDLRETIEALQEVARAGAFACDDQTYDSLNKLNARILALPDWLKDG